MSKSDILAAADLCVKCGLCLPHCPTYLKTSNENESPRGRIALIQAWAGDQLEATNKLVEHIDNCLLCRSCERVCPAVVPYSQLVDQFRQQHPNNHHETIAVSLLRKISQNKKLNKYAQSGLKLYQNSAAQKLVRKLRLSKISNLASIDLLLPEQQAGEFELATELFPTHPPKKGKVALFHGCMGLMLEQETVQSAIQVLNHIGYDVHVPSQQTCCGALDLHAGDGATAVKLQTQNTGVFNDPSYEAIISIASGCGSQLQEYQADSFRNKVVDVCQFVGNNGVDLSKDLAPLNDRICLHAPCTLKNVMRAEEWALQLLKQIPEAKITPLDDSIKCCGSAGSYMIDHPVMAKELVNDLIAAIEGQPTYLATSNIGCALHIRAALRENQVNCEVVHPIVLIARQLNK